MITSRFFVAAAALAAVASLTTAARAEFPTLREAIDKARVSGPQTILAAADVRVAGATRHAAGLPPLTNPYLEVFVDRTKSTVGAAQFQANLWLPIELSGQRGARVAEVESMVKWKQTARIAAQAGAVGDAVTAFGETIIAAARVEHAAEALKVAKEEAAYVQGRFEAKDATVVDKALAEGEVARWVSEHETAQLTYSLAHARLSIAIGDPGLGAPRTDVVVDLPELKWKDGDALAKHLVESSPALQSYQQEADFFLASKEKWQADKYAPVNFIVSAGRSDLGEFRFGGGVAWTLPVLRKNQGEIARAEAEADRAKTSYAIAATAIAARAKGFFQAYQVARKALQTIDTVAVPAARSVVEATVTAWKAGKADLTRVFLARRDLATALERRLEIASAGWTAYGDLARLVGEAP